jgi:hypothetical protein
MTAERKTDVVWTDYDREAGQSTKHVCRGRSGCLVHMVIRLAPVSEDKGQDSMTSGR